MRSVHALCNYNIASGNLFYEIPNIDKLMKE